MRDMSEDNSINENTGEQDVRPGAQQGCTDEDPAGAIEQGDVEQLQEDAAAAETTADAARARPRKRQKREVIVVQAYSMMVLAAVIMTFIGRSFVVEGASMEPTLHNRERIIVEKVSYRLHGPQRGDIVVLKNPWRPDFTGWDAAAEAMREIVDLSGSMRPYIKRIVAVEGDTIQIYGGIVYLNGQALEEDYIADRPRMDYPLSTVPEDHVFVMGDNRNNSDDSRGSVGFLRESRIMGRAVFRYYPLNRVTALSRPDVFGD